MQLTDWPEMRYYTTIPPFLAKYLGLMGCIVTLEYWWKRSGSIHNDFQIGFWTIFQRLDVRGSWLYNVCASYFLVCWKISNKHCQVFYVGVLCQKLQNMTIWLVVGNMTFIFLYIGNVIIPTDFHILQRGRYTTNQLWNSNVCSAFVQVLLSRFCCSRSRGDHYGGNLCRAGAAGWWCNAIHILLIKHSWLGNGYGMVWVKIEYLNHWIVTTKNGLKFVVPPGL